jgi:AcrR family transcriptional regulator
MKNTKQKILDTARNLFNKNGYSQVTIRMLAQDLKISSGNLNYHFKKREAILEALYFEMVAVFDQRAQSLSDQKLTLEYTQLSIQTSMERMVDYRFFWNDLFYILQSNLKIQQHFEQAKVNRIKGYEYLFDAFIKQGILTPASFPLEYKLLAERMIDYSNTWLYASNLYETTASTQQMIEKASLQLILFLYPYLTTRGQQEIQELYPLTLRLK